MEQSVKNNSLADVIDKHSFVFGGSVCICGYYKQFEEYDGCLDEEAIPFQEQPHTHYL